MTRAISRVVLGVIVSCSVMVAGQAPSDTLLVTGGTLIDGTGSAPQPGVAVLVQGNKIAAIGKAGQLTAPAGARTIRADGKFILPGLWDPHIHYRWWHGELMLHYGVTTAADLGNRTAWILAVRDGIAKGKVRAPRLLSTGWMLFSGNERPVAGQEQGPPPRRIVRPSEATEEYHVKENIPNDIVVYGGPEAMREFVLSEIEAGVDGFKVLPNMTREELRVVTSEAHKRGLTVIAHATHAFDQIEDGIDGVAHLHCLAETLMTDKEKADARAGRIHTPYVAFRKENTAKIDELIALMVKRQVYLSPGLLHEHAPVVAATDEFEKEDRQILSNPNLAYIPEEMRLAARDYLHMFRSSRSHRYGYWVPKEMLPPDVVQQFRQGYEDSKELIRRFVRAGGKLFQGSDVGGTAFIPGLIVHREMRLLVEEVGLTPMDAILSATRDAAGAMKKQATMGTVEVGKIADLLILNADPLANIRNTQKIDAVIKDGQIVDRTLHRNYSVPFPEVGHEGAFNTSWAVPGIIRLTPEVVVEGAPDTRVELEGSGLMMESKVFVDGIPVSAELTDSDHITFTIPAKLLATGGSKRVTVVNRSPGGGTSTAYGFVVRFK